MRGAGGALMARVEVDYDAMEYLDPLAFKLLEFARYNSLDFEAGQLSIIRAQRVMALIDTLPAVEGRRFVLRIARETKKDCYGFYDAQTGERLHYIEEWREPPTPEAIKADLAKERTAN